WLTKSCCFSLICMLHSDLSLTFFANRNIFVLAVIVSLPVSQVAGVNCHCDSKELFGFLVICQAAKE
uniref:Chemokine interleukin-8-like domain-containing protein n=1 Tax=Labrus bergylta TaxID=56723 RepID=A0A3Q3FYH6_9LABR